MTLTKVCSILVNIGDISCHLLKCVEESQTKGVEAFAFWTKKMCSALWKWNNACWSKTKSVRIAGLGAELGTARNQGLAVNDKGHIDEREDRQRQRIRECKTWRIFEEVIYALESLAVNVNIKCYIFMHAGLMRWWLVSTTPKTLSTFFGKLIRYLLTLLDVYSLYFKSRSIIDV